MANNTSASRQVHRTGPVEQTPYVGPRPFGLEDRDIFFGRNQEAIEFTSLIKAHPEVLLYAPSGAGKSSLIYAQVIPILKEEEDFDVLPAARVRSQDSAAISEEEIKNIYIFNALKDLSDNSLGVTERANMTLAAYLKQVPRPPVRSSPNVEEDPGKVNPDIPVETRLARVIIFDQFEEIFTLYPERYKDRQDFFCQVADALKADPFLRVVFSMREDYIAELDPYIHVLPEKLRTGFRLERLRQPNARSAVKEPLKSERVKNTGRRFADGVAESLVESLMLIKVKTASGEKKEVPGEFVDPVQLQVVCQTLWEKLPKEESIITTEHLEKYANVEEALSDFYESSIRKAVATYNAAIESSGTESVPVSKMTEGEVRGWFEKVLITREGKRNMVLRERQMTGGLSNLVVDELENQHLVRVEMRGGEPWYELSHDRFITPIRESNRRWLLEQPWAAQKARELETRAAEWLAANRDPSMLLDRTSLAEANIWLASPEAKAIGYSETLYAFIKASEVVIEHEDRKYERALVAEQESRMLAEHRRARQFKLGLVVVSVLLMFAFASAVYGFINGRRAESNRDKAENNRVKAEKALDDVITAQTKEQEERRRVVEKTKELERALEDLTAANSATRAAKDRAEAARRRAELAQASAEAAWRVAKREQKELDKEFDKEQSRRLSAQADNFLSKQPMEALQYAFAAHKKSETEEARYSLRRAYQRASEDLRASENLPRKESAVLLGHTNTVWNAMYGPDSRSILTSSEDRTLRIWNAKTYELEKVLVGHDRGVHALAINQNGLIATEAGDSTARIWNVADNKSIVLPGLSGPLAAIAFSPNGKLLATEATDETLPYKTKEEQTKADTMRGASPKIWDVTTGKPLRQLSGHDLAVVALAFSPQGDRLATASWDKTARIWDVNTGREITVFRKHTDRVTSVAFHPNGELVVTSSDDGSARVWDAETGNEQMVLIGPITVLQNITFSPNGRFILMGGSIRIPAVRALAPAPIDNTVWLWEAKTGRLLAILTGHTRKVTSAQFSSDKDNSLIVTASDDGSAIVWRTSTGQKVTEFRGHGRSVKSALFSPDNKSVVTTSEDSTARVWAIGDAAGEQRVYSALSVRFSTDGKSIVSVNENGTSSRQKNGEPIAGEDRKLEVGQVYDAVISPNNNLVVIASRLRPLRRGESASNEARVWNTSSKETPQPLTGHSAPVIHVSCSDSGTYVLTVSANGTAHVWGKQQSKWERIRVFEPGQVEGEKKVSPIRAAAFDPGEKYVITAQENGSVHLWEISTGRNISVIKAHTDAVTAVAFSAKGDLIVTASEDETAKVWMTVLKDGAIDTLKLRSTIRGHKGPVYDGKFSPSGEFVVTSGIDRTVRVWETTGEPVNVFDVPGGATREVAFSPDSSSIVARDTSGRVFVLECEACHPIEVVKDLAYKNYPQYINPKEIDKILEKAR